MPLYTAVLGGEVHVPTLKGTNLALTIPAGTQNGRMFRLKGQGMPHLGNPDQRGDLLAKVEVAAAASSSATRKDNFSSSYNVYIVSGSTA